MSDNGVVYGDAGRIKAQFVRWKEECDNGKLAKLERGDAFALLFPLIQNNENRQRAEDVGLLVGNCYGISRRHMDIGNFGSSLRKLSMQVGGNGVQMRANRIIMANKLEDIQKVLPSMVRWMKQKSVGIDFWKLYIDLYFWGDKVRRKWASDFYNGNKDE